MGQSLGGFTAPLVCDRVPVEVLVLVAAMVPSPGETGLDWWDNTGYEQAAAAAPDHNGDEIAVFLQDVPPDLAREALERGRDQSATPMHEPWPLDAWPDVPTRYLPVQPGPVLPGGVDAAMVRERLAITPDEIDCGHTPALSRPMELADRLEGYAAETKRNERRAR